jgi:hypothetical protein
MVPFNVPDLPAPATFVQCDSDIGLVLVPKTTAKRWRRLGMRRVRVEITLSGAPPPEAWLTQADAARLHQEDVDGLTLQAARMRVVRACQSGRVQADRIKGVCYIEPVSLNAWRLEERERNLKRPMKGEPLDDDLDPGEEA